MGLLLFVLPDAVGLSGQTLNGYTLTLLYLLVPLDVIGSMLPNLGRAKIALASVKSLGLSLEANSSEDAVTAPTTDLHPARVSIELRGVTHTYGGRRDCSDHRPTPRTRLDRVARRHAHVPPRAREQ
jgi:ABC-type siderophore export system fused ATPase/permease subunit